jgi:hypothetical protein
MRILGFLLAAVGCADGGTASEDEWVREAATGSRLREPHLLDALGRNRRGSNSRLGAHVDAQRIGSP